MIISATLSCVLTWAYLHCVILEKVESWSIPKSTLYIWEGDRGPGWFGHAALKTEFGAYVSRFPGQGTQFWKGSLYKTAEEDLDFYGRQADYIIHLNLPQERKAHGEALAALERNDPWRPWDNCADTVERILNAGGLSTPQDEVLNEPSRLKSEIEELKRKSVESEGREMWPIFWGPEGKSLLIVSPAE